MDKATKYIAVAVVLTFFLCFSAYRSFVVYQPGVYVCRHMAHDQEIWLEEHGCDTKIYRGVSKFNGEGHVWCAVNNIPGVLISFDSVGLYPFVPYLLYDNIIMYENYSDYQKMFQ